MGKILYSTMRRYDSGIGTIDTLEGIGGKNASVVGSVLVCMVCEQEGHVGLYTTHRRSALYSRRNQ